MNSLLFIYNAKSGAINKLKKTCDAIEGDIAGFGEDYIVAVPNFAEIYRNKETEEVKED